MIAANLRLSWFLSLALGAVICGCGDDGGGALGSPDAGDVADSGGADAEGGDAGVDPADATEDAAADDDPADGGIDTGPSVRDDLAWPVADRGPYQVGFRELELTYDLPGTVEQRTVPVFVWYPTDETDGVNPPGASLLGLGPQSEVWAEAEPRPPTSDDGYPVFMYSHGHRAWGENTWQLMRHFASHGWIAASPEHVLNTISDGDLAPAYIHYARVFDVRESIDLIDELTADFPGRAATERVVVAGHSRGGTTVWAIGGASFGADEIAAICAAEDDFYTTCTPEEQAVYVGGVADERVVGIVPMDGGPRDDLFGVDGMFDLDVPVMQLAANDNQRGTYEAFSQAGGAIAWAALDGACHEAFTIGSSTDIGGCEATLSDEDGFLITNTYALAFARWVALGDHTEATMAILEGGQQVHTAVRYRQSLFE